MAGSIVFNSIYVNAQETNAGVFIGETAATGWDSHNKVQMSVGLVFNAYGGGQNNSGNLYLLSDNDLFDTVIQDGFEAEGGPTVQT